MKQKQKTTSNNPVKEYEDQQEGKIDDRERDIQKLCAGIMAKGIESTGDYGDGGQCPFCYKNCIWNADSLNDISHEPDCIFLIAKDLSTNLKNIKP